jgi:type VII secretion-associated serine protease mycosin
VASGLVALASLAAVPPGPARAAAPPDHPVVPDRRSANTATALGSAITKGEVVPEVDTSHLFLRPARPATELAPRLQRAGARAERAVRGTGWTVLETPAGDAERVRNELAADPTVGRVELAYRRHASKVPNDPAWPNGQSSYLGPLRVDRAWDTTQGAGVTIAVLDTGVDLNQPDFAGRLLPGFDFVNNDSNPTDDVGHGTMVAGVAAAATNNNMGIAGIAGQAKVLPVKVLNSQGFGSDADFATAIVWATDHGADVINMSFGGGLASEPLVDAIDYALAHDVVVVAAAGNDAAETVEFPARVPGVIAVSATGDDGGIAYFSSYGWRVDVAAPGVEIISTAYHSNGQPKVDVASGTSFSSPLVAGVAALIRAAFPAMTQAEVADRIRATARDVGPHGPDSAYGAGVVDPLAAVGGPLPAARPSLRSGSEEPNDAPDDAVTITGSRSASISPEVDADWYRMQLTSGLYYRVAVTPTLSEDSLDPRSLDAVIEVFDPNGKFLIRRDAGFPDEPEILTFPVTTSGQYSLRITNLNASKSPGPYQLSVTTTAPPASRFAPLLELPIGAQAGVISIADVTGDGRSDLVFLTKYFGDAGLTNKLVVLRQRPDRSLEFSQLLDTAFGQADAMAVGDLDGDQLADVAVETLSGLQIFHQSNGTLEEPTTILPGVLFHHLVITDVDADGKNDLVAAGAYYRNTGSGFTQVPTFLSFPTGFSTVGDVTGDTRNDIVTAGLGVSAQNPDGTFTAVVAPAAANTRDAGIGDLNADGRHDILTVDGQGPGAFRLYPQLVNGTIGAASVRAVDDFPQAVEVADVNADSHDDIVMLHGGGGVGVVLQQANGTLGAETLFSTPSWPAFDASQLAVGDLDSDGALDVVVATNDGLAALYQNPTSLPGLEPVWVRDAEPTNLTVNVAGSVAPTIEFGRALDGATVNASTVRLVAKNGAPVAAAVAYDAGANVATLTPVAPLAPGPYVARIDGVADLAGESLVDFGTRFTVGPTPDQAAPQTTITSKPPPHTDVHQAIVKFAANEGGTAFECSFDNAAYQSCSSPYVRTVTNGTHTLQVFGRDAAGNEDPTPATATWTVHPPARGYWMLGGDGAVYAFGTVSNLGRGTPTATDIEATPTGFGYWIVDRTGRVSALGDASWFGNASGLVAGELVTSISRTKSGGGYWLFTSRGRVFNFGNAPFLGDMRATPLNGPVLDSVATTTGKGYYMVASDGGVFAFGDARFYGSMGGSRLNAPVRSLVPDADGVGYWLVASDGGVFAFRAAFRGSMGGTQLNQPIVGMVRFGIGYLMVAADGGVFNFSNKPFFGSLASKPPAVPIVSIAARD